MIYDILPTGSEYPMTAKEICGRLDIKPRELTIRIMAERRAGFPICASTTTPTGYFKPATLEELRGFCCSLRHRAGEIFATRRALLAKLKEYEALGGVVDESHKWGNSGGLAVMRHEAGGGLQAWHE